MDEFGGPLRFDVESVLDFRLARLLLVLDEAQSTGVVIDTIDRIGYLDFFAANPFAILAEDDNLPADRLKLALSGFADRQLAYHSVGHRYVTRRKSLQEDLAIMFALGALSITAAGYELTDTGHVASRALESAYGDSIRASSRIVTRRIGRLSRKKLYEEAERALGKSWLLIDLLDDVRDTEIVETEDARG
jgi:hypothetical protein